MKWTLVEKLYCPQCSGRLECRVFSNKKVEYLDPTVFVFCKDFCSKNGKKIEIDSNLNCSECVKEEIYDGMLFCKDCEVFFPIIEGIPRILFSAALDSLVPEYRNFLKRFNFPSQSSKDEQRFSLGTGCIETANGFNFQWFKYPDILEEHEKEFLHVITPLFSSDRFKAKTVLDAGCGQGRFTKFSLKYGAKEVYGVDLSNAITIAHDNLSAFANIHLIQGDICTLPIKPIFDFVFAIGVIHHLPEPGKGFKCLLDYIKPRGEIFIWVYGYSSIVPILKFMRFFASGLSKNLMWYLSLIPAGILSGVILYYRMLAKIGLDYIADKIPFRQYADRSFKNIHMISFDHLTTPIVNYYKKPELEELVRNKKLAEVQISERYGGMLGSSWRVYGRKGQF